MTPKKTQEYVVSSSLPMELPMRPAFVAANCSAEAWGERALLGPSPVDVRSVCTAGYVNKKENNLKKYNALFCRIKQLSCTCYGYIVLLYVLSCGTHTYIYDM